MSGVLGGAAVVGAAGVVGSAISQAQSAGDALDAQADQNALNTAFILQQAQKSRRDTLPLFKSAQADLNLANQRGLDIFGQSIKGQSRLTQGGNVKAQKQLLAGLGLQKGALLGDEIDLSQLQAQRLNVPELGPRMTQLPNFKLPNLNPNRFGTSPADQALAAQNAQSLNGTGQVVPDQTGQPAGSQFTRAQIQAALANNQGNLGPAAQEAIRKRLLGLAATADLGGTN